MAINQDTRRKEVWSPPDQSSQQFMEHIEVIEKRLDRIEKHIGLGADKAKLEDLEKSRQEVAALRERLETALEHIQEKEKQLQDTQDRMTNHANRIQELEEERQKLSSLVQTLQTELTTSEQKVQTLENELHIVKKDLQDAKGRLDRTEKELEETKSKQAQTDEGLKTLQAQVARLAVGVVRDQAATPTDVTMSVVETPREEGHVSQLTTLGGAPLGLPPIRISKNIINSKTMNFPPHK